MDRNRNLIIIGTMAVLLIAIAIGQGTGKTFYGNTNLGLKNLPAGTKLGRCNLTGNYTIDIKIYKNDKINKKLNYSASILFPKQNCGNGLAPNHEISYSGTTIKQAIANDLKTQLTKTLNRFKRFKFRDKKQYNGGYFKGNG